jgi:hypothetical protein
MNARNALLRDMSIPPCQQLHFLQMACEKICKAFLCWRGSDPQMLQSSHAYIATTLPQIVRQQLSRQPRQVQANSAWITSAIQKLSRQIELLAPSVDSGGRVPANCEYPWEDSRTGVHVPAEHNFAIDLLYAKAGRILIKAIWASIDELIGGAV